MERDTQWNVRAQNRCLGALPNENERTLMRRCWRTEYDMYRALRIVIRREKQWAKENQIDKRCSNQTSSGGNYRLRVKVTMRFALRLRLIVLWQSTSFKLSTPPQRRATTTMMKRARRQVHDKHGRRWNSCVEEGITQKETTGADSHTDEETTVWSML